MEQRVKALRSTFDEAGIDGMLISDPANRRYLSGFTGSAGVLLIDAERAILVTDGRYTSQAEEQSPGFEIVTRGLTETLPAAAASRLGAIRRVGFEAGAMTFAEHGDYRQLCGEVELVPVSGLAERGRSVKDAGELAALRRAIQITDEALARVRPLLRPEMTERDAAWELHKAIHELGGAGLSFETIVAAGPNSARPHARPGAAPLGLGRPIVIDFGALFDGYHADMTRTLILGEADDQFWRIYNTVREALETARRGIKPGTSGQDADALARDVIAAAGFGEAFGHGLGHGVGLVIHEGPSLRMNAQQPLEINQVFSIEPGIYLPEWGGVRLEDLALLQVDGVETLTQSPLDDPVVRLP
ncbi:MAG TPA: Xaa-Pro peptidase family protein [Herpetosiphonaceae bacterium]